ncbi:polyprenyl synthetase family protein [Candidatus Haliotispira prima]|uniref:Polyprenyl synthetase family protein n=1 Tax=Candidatus Haliotispira prima TaxID=3034016 RepID=A0ABY8MI29_9SPIO|nr:polyprenyl synthetase family protein [Candidatus Haliotispira prima]
MSLTSNSSGASDIPDTPEFSALIQEQIEQYLRDCLQMDYILEHCDLPSAEFASGPYREAIRVALGEVLEPMQELVFLPGKRWRPALSLLHALLGCGGNAGHELKSSRCRELLGPLVVLVELLHNATLVADDIEDNGKLRRGIPAIHLSYGLDRALNGCNWAYFLSDTLLRPLEQYLTTCAAASTGWGLALRLRSLSQQCLSQIHLGQALDIRWHRQHGYVPHTEAYFCMASLKTGALAGFAAEVGVLAGQALWNGGGAEYGLTARNCRELWLRIGLAFQVLDDLINITVGNPGKLRGDDWLEGKRGLPLCLFVEQGHESGKSGEGERRQQFVASLMAKVQESAAGQEWNHESKQEDNPRLLVPLKQPLEQPLKQVLDQVLDEFLYCEGGREALHGSVVWLERELGACRGLAEPLYLRYGQGPGLNLGRGPCPGELLALLAKLDVETQRCRDFLD